MHTLVENFLWEERDDGDGNLQFQYVIEISIIISLLDVNSRHIEQNNNDYNYSSLLIWF